MKCRRGWLLRGRQWRVAVSFPERSPEQSLLILESSWQWAKLRLRFAERDSDGNRRRCRKWSDARKIGRCHFVATHQRSGKARPAAEVLSDRLSARRLTHCIHDLVLRGVGVFLQGPPPLHALGRQRGECGMCRQSDLLALRMLSEKLSARLSRVVDRMCRGARLPRGPCIGAGMNGRVISDWTDEGMRQRLSDRELGPGRSGAIKLVIFRGQSGARLRVHLRQIGLVRLDA